MRAGDPAGTVEFVVIKMIAGNQLRMLRAAALDAVADIEDDDAVAPISKIGETVDDLKIVKITASHGETAARFGGNGNLHRSLAGIFKLPASHFLWIFHIGEIDDAHGASSVVGEIDVMRIDVRTVHAAGDGGGVFGENFGMEGIGGVQEDDAVFAIGCALASDDTDFAIGSDADVID